MESVIITLIAFLIAQQVLFFWVIHKLVNKIMAGTYSDYVACENQKKQTKREIKVQIPPEEDLGIMQDFAPVP